MPKSDPSSEDIIGASPPVAGRDFERLVALSCWFILVLEDEPDVVADDVDYMLEEFGDESSNERAPVRELEPWQQWRALGDVESDEEFAEMLNGEILPDLLLRFRGTSSPLALVPAALESLPISMLRTMLHAALEYDAESTIGAGELPLDEMRNLWNYWQDKCDLTEPRYGVVFSSTLSEFLVNALSPDPDKAVYDLCARDGAALAECAERGVRRLFAVEQNARLAVVAYTRLWLDSETRLVVRCGSPLEYPPPTEGYDYVIGNLPWGGKVASDRLRSQFPVTTDSQELLYLQHGLAALKPGGRAAFVVPLGILFRSGAAQQVRELLLREYCVDAVIELPANTFMPATAARGAVLLVRRDAPPKDVWFITSEQFSNAVEHRSYTEDDLDHEILMVALHARKGDMDIAAVRSEIDRLAKRAELPESTKDCDPEAAKWLTENSRQMLTLARHFIGEETPDADFPELVPFDRLAKRNWELLWKGDQSDGVDKWLNPIEQIPGARIATLGELASEIFVGIPYTSAMTSVNIGGILATPEDGDTSVALVRVSDLSKPKAEGRTMVHTHKALKPDALTSVQERQYLKSGDLLISRSGTVGRTGVYVAKLKTEPSQPAVATNGVIVVRLGDEALAHFLADLIQTAPYQEALQSETTGSVIRHLRTETLRSLRVPVLPRAEMVRLREVIRPGVSGETMLAALESRPGYTVALRYLIDSPEVREFAARPLDEPWSATRNALSELRLQWERAERETGSGEQDPFLDWVVGFVRASGELEEILGFQPGADQFAALQSWRQRLRGSEFGKAYRAIRRKVDSGEAANAALPRAVQKRCEEVYDRLTALSLSVANALLADIRVTATISPAVVTVGKPVELTIAVRNAGPLPLKRVTLDVSSGAGASRPWPLLPAQGTNQWPHLWTPEIAGQKIFHFAWKAVRLDEQPCSGNFELAVDVQPLSTEVKSKRLDVSPYITGTSLSARDRDLFFGRNDVLDEIRRSLRPTGPGTVLILDGVRRVGKTSVLKQLLAPDALPGWLPVYYCLQGASGDETSHGVPTREMFYEIAKELILSAHGSGCTVDVPDFRSVSPTDTTKQLRLDMRTTLRGKFSADPAPFELFEMVVTSVLEALDGRRLLLMLDEFDKVQVGIESGVTNRNVPENFRELIHRHEKVSAILTGSQLMKTLRREYFHPLFGIGKAIPIGALDRPSAQLLVTRPVEGTLTFSDAARDAIVDLCGCQPFLIQHLCSAVFDIAAREGLESLTTEHVEQAVTKWLERDQHFAIVLKSDVDDPRRQCVLFVIAELERRGVAVTFEILRDALEERGLAGDAALTDHLQYLADATVVSCGGTDDLKVYRITIPLLARWLARQDAALYLARAQRFDEGRL